MTMGSVPVAGKSQTLPASLTRKLSQCGAYDAEVSFVKAARRLTQSAGRLRMLIDSIYGKDVERVKNTIREMVTDKGFLAAGLAGMQAEAMLYDEMAALIKEGEFEFHLVAD